MRTYFSAAVILLLFLVSACDPCKNTTCQHNGECVEGDCKCPSPYGGAHCETDLCIGKDCGNHGNCYYGNCECQAGYEGYHCEKLETDKFIGNFQLTGNCDSAYQSHPVTVYASGIIS